MDEINSGFGNLSMNAAEWTPAGGSGNSGSANTSDLNADAVKEFIPGLRWVASTTDTSSSLQQGALAEHASDTNQQYATSSVPSGPSAAPPPSYRALHSLSISDELYRYHRDLSLESIRQMDPDDPRHKAVPLPYCNAYCLDLTSNANQRRGVTTRSSFGYPSATFQVTNRDDGHLYCLKRFDNVRSVSPKIAAAVSDRWTAAVAVAQHPGVVPLYQCFIAQRAVFFVHQYIPGARSLAERMANNTLANRGGSAGTLFSEPILWSALAQLTSAIRTIHGHNLAVRTLRLQHVLSNYYPADYHDDTMGGSPHSRIRLRLGSLGVVDALEFEARKHVNDLQMEDIRDLGRLIVSMATGTDLFAHSLESNGTHSTTGIFNRCEQYMAQRYSRELHSLTMTLIMSQPKPPSVQDISRAILAARTFDEQDAGYRAYDRSERALAAEYESGRAFRLLLKLGFINERPELGPNRRWTQSGDCYILTLFRDYVFHQADGAGYPVMDLGHVVTALNKLDAADEEKIVLTSRDGKSMMVVSYADVSRCLESAYLELCSAAAPPLSLQY